MRAFTFCLSVNIKVSQKSQTVHICEQTFSVSKYQCIRVLAVSGDKPDTQTMESRGRSDPDWSTARVRRRDAHVSLLEHTSVTEPEPE